MKYDVDVTLREFLMLINDNLTNITIIDADDNMIGTASTREWFGAIKNATPVTDSGLVLDGDEGLTFIELEDKVIGLDVSAF